MLLSLISKKQEINKLLKKLKRDTYFIDHYFLKEILFKIQEY